MIQEINGYKYEIEAEAASARLRCANHYGLPKTPDDTTLHWVDYQEATLDTPIFWYIIFDPSLTIILGTPLIFNVTVEDL